MHIVWYALQYVKRAAHADLVPGARAHRARGTLHPIRAQAPRGGDAGPFLVVPALPAVRAPPPLSRARAAPRAAREWEGRRRRIFSITEAGQAALRAWLGRPSGEPSELRDPGLLQLFFADLGPPEARASIAAEQLVIHRAKLADYEEDQRLEPGPRAAGPGGRTVERWRGETVRMGLLYERAAVDFWAGIVESADRADGGAARARAEDDEARVTW